MTLINKESLLLVMNTLSENADPSVLDWEFAVDVVRTAPEADLVQHGKWEHKEVFPARGNVEELQSAFCPVCERYHTTPYSYYFCEYKYCPNCGARMDGEKDETD